MNEALGSQLVTFMLGHAAASHRLDEFVPQRTSAYVDQRDVHIAELSVRDLRHHPVSPVYSYVIYLSGFLPLLLKRIFKSS